jgi:hypothetical protein
MHNSGGTKMVNFKTTAITLVAFAIMGVFVATMAFAAEKDLGKHSQDEIKNACNAAGGELLGVSDLGSYGCEVASKGTMILCNKDGNCTGYTPARTRSDHNRILGSLKLTTKPVTR